MNDQNPSQPQKYQSFAEFYPHYLAEHQNGTDRTLHVIGTVLAGVTLVTSLVLRMPLLLLLVPVFGYGFAWVGHFVFEKNKPTTFHHPFYSLLGDLVLVMDVLTGKGARR